MERIWLSVYLVVLSIFDGRERRIPVVLVSGGLLATVGSVVYRCIQNPMNWRWIALSALLGAVPGAVMLAVVFLTGKVGLGDGLVLVGVGMLTGYGGCMLLICFSLLFMSLWCIALLCCRKGTRNTKVPYLPFLTAVYLASLII